MSEASADPSTLPPPPPPPPPLPPDLTLSGCFGVALASGLNNCSAASLPSLPTAKGLPLLNVPFAAPLSAPYAAPIVFAPPGLPRHPSAAPPAKPLAVFAIGEKKLPTPFFILPHIPVTPGSACPSLM